ncbi:MAG: hypothetical protein M0R03_15550 [Novosphingobium sp.]|nr:hypothetical protein [Novosphingobium sp.]
MNTFYFNTGVNPSNVINFPYEYHRKIGNVIRGTLLIPMECDAPSNATFMFGCDNPNLDESKAENVLVTPILNSNLSSKYGYFRLNPTTEM